MDNNFSILMNEQQQQFQISAEEELAFLEYRWVKKAIALMHTFVPEKLEGKGIAGALAKFALEYSVANKLKVIVYCPFVTAWLLRHPEYNSLIVKLEDLD